MSESIPENDAWAGEDATPAAGGVTFPERPDNPHEAPLSVNFKPGGSPQLTVRGRTVEEHMALLKEVQSSGLLALIASVNAAFGGQGAAHAPQMPAQGYQAATPPPFGPNVSVPQAPGYAGPQVPAAPQWGAPAPQSGGFGGGLPAGWYKMKVPFAQKATFDGIVSQYGLKKGDPFRGGQVSWRKEEKLWACSPDVAGAFAQFNPVAA